MNRRLYKTSTPCWALATALLSLFLTACLASPVEEEEEEGDSPPDVVQPQPTPPSYSPIKAARCEPGDSFDVTVVSRNGIQIPASVVGKKSNGKSYGKALGFWIWYLKWLFDKNNPAFGRDLQFPLQDPRIVEAQLNTTRVQVEALVFNEDKIRWDRLILGVDGIKGAQIDPSAVQIEVVDEYPFDIPLYVPKGLAKLLKDGEHPSENDDDSDSDHDNGKSKDNSGKGNNNDKNKDGDSDHDNGKGNNDKDKDNDKNDDKKDDKVWLKAFSRVRLTVDLKKFSFGGIQTADDILKAAAAEHRAVSIRIKHLDGGFRLLGGALKIAGTSAGECEEPPPNPDTQAPTIRIESQAVSGLSGTTTQSVSFSADEPVAFTCSFNQGAWTACSSQENNRFGLWETTGLSDGAQHLSVRATDAAGNVSTVETLTWSVDTTAPQLTLVSAVPPEALTDSTSLELAYSTSETSQTVCSIDNGTPFACQSPVSFSGLVDGNHRVTIQAMDLVGHTGAALAYEWRVQALPPSVLIVGIQPSASPTTSNVITIEFLATGAKNYLCSLDGSDPVFCTSPVVYSELEDGSHTFEVRAVDGLNRIGAPASHAWTVDTLVPEVFFVSIEPFQNPTPSQDFRFKFGASETAQLLCSLDGQAETACESPYDLASLSEGEHSFRVRAIDTAGNQSSSNAEYIWIVDRTPATTRLLSTNPSGAVVNVSQMTLTFDSQEPATFECSTDGVVYSACSSPVVYKALADGNQTVSIRAIDRAGNVGPAVSHAFSVDTQAPSVSITSVVPSAAVTNQTSREIFFSTNESGAFLECAFDANAYTACSSSVTLSNLTEGSHTFKVRARDAAGNETLAPAQVSWRVDLTAPDASIISKDPNTSVTDSTSIVFEFATNEAGSTFECQRDEESYSVCSSPLVLNNLADGSHTFRVRAVDAAGNVDATPASYSWQVITTPLSISGFAVGGITKTSATVTWSTSRTANSRIEVTHVLTGAVLVFENSAQVTSHSVQATGLATNTLYSVVAISTTSSGQTARSSAFSFRTAR